MDFDNLPSNIFLKLLRYLPIKVQVRIGRVNKRFQEISHIVLSEIKSIDSTDPQFQRLDVHSLSNLLNLCKSNLKEIKIYLNDAWLEIFAQYSCPNLIELEIKTTSSFMVHVNDFFGRIMENNRNLQNIFWWDKKKKYLTFPDVICEKWEKIMIGGINDDTVRSMMGRCPNLREFMNDGNNRAMTLSGQVLDCFFFTCPKLESLCLDEKIDCQFDQLTHFWRLNSLRELCLCGKLPAFDDHDLMKISTSFPKLEILALVNIYMTNAGLVALASLKKLQDLNLYRINEIYGSVDLGMRRLIDCEHLQQVEVKVDITSTTLIALVQRCHELRYFSIEKVIDVEMIEQAVTVVQAFDGVDKRKISIHPSLKEIWNSGEVQKAVEELKAKGHDVEVKCFSM